VCENRYAIYKKEPDCSKCVFNFVKIKELNDSYIFKIWNLVYQQEIIGFNGPVCINICAVIEVINLFDIKDNNYKLELLSAIIETWNYFYDKRKKENNKGKGV